QRRGKDFHAHGDLGLPQAEEIHRHLRPGAKRPSRPRALAARRRHRIDLAESGHRRRDLARSRQAVTNASGTNLASEVSPVGTRLKDEPRSTAPEFVGPETHLAKGALFAIVAAVGFSLTGIC